MIDIKPCPFCACGKIELNSSFDKDIKGKCYFISCESCGADGPYLKFEHDDDSIDYQNKFNECLDEWNNRL